MSYENHQPSEGINVSNEHPLKEFAQLLIGIGLVCIIAVVTLSFVSSALAKRIPFEFEQTMIERFDYFKASDSSTAKQLQNLAKRLSQHMDLPSNIELTVHYDDSDTVNALATLGGNIVFFEGLIKELESEDELAAVMAHEIAHIKLRHPISGLGKGISIAAFAAFMSGLSGNTAGDWLLGNSAQLTLMSYSRRQEAAADLLAAQALQAEYGHIEGAERLFQRFSELEAKSIINDINIEAFRSHPYSDNRWAKLVSEAANANWNLSGDLTPLSLSTKANDKK